METKSTQTNKQKQQWNPQRTDWWLPEVADKMGEGGQKALTVIKWMSPEDIMYSMLNIVDNTVLYIWKVLRVNLKSSHHKENI